MKLYIFFIILSFLLSGCFTPKIKESPVKTLTMENKPQNIKIFFQSSQWWDNTNNPQLISLINEVLKTNSDIKISKLNIEKAIYTLNSTKNSNLSAITLGGSWDRNHVVNSHVKTDLPIKDIKNSDTIDMGNLAIQGEYIFDIWGKFDALQNQAQYSQLASQLKSEWSILTLSTTVANIYGKYILLIKQQQILDNKLDISKEVLSFQNTLYTTGLGDKESVRKASNNVNSLVQKISEVNNQKTILKNSLYSLIGNAKSEVIDNILLNISNNTNISFDYFLDIPEYIDSDIVVNRPDVKYYLALINSQKENLKSLKSDFYPRFSISGKYEYQNINVQNLLKAHSTLWDFGPSLYLPLFNRNTLIQNYNIGGVDLNIFIENYNNNLIKAYQDINNNLNTLKTSKTDNILEEKNYNNTKAIYNDNNILYQIGSISKLELLNYKSNLLNAELNYIENSFSLYTNQINLIGSLGGYYKNEVK